MAVLIIYIGSELFDTVHRVGCGGFEGMPIIVPDVRTTSKPKLSGTALTGTLVLQLNN